MGGLMVLLMCTLKIVCHSECMRWKEYFSGIAVVQSWMTLDGLMDHISPGRPIFCDLLKSGQPLVHHLCDTVYPSHCAFQ
ncbi:hypothetical protein M514_01353, partial [Trichuris suis]